MIKLDMQVHSYHSYDSISSPEAIAETARRKGLNGFSITDHNVFRVDYVQLRQKYPDMIMIPGMEIGTEFGDMLLYFIKDEIKTRKAEDVIDLAHEQGGIAVLAHPYHRRHYDYPEAILKKLDGIETRNAHNIENSKIADDLGGKCGKCITGGSDAHFLFEIGNGFTLVDFDKSKAVDLQELKEAFIKSASPDCIKGPSWTFVVSQMIKYAKRIQRHLTG
ncbi:MAG TPA: hypothetical protein DET40_11430 [Lentisphaeria bacterium]|nr:MAG: hypothetical protein A2X45_19760 [Lentisphaerae bacterium GWF2_50_93]HCE44151.1 hypothetical protein [Lentisphaeria bacterium]